MNLFSRQQRKTFRQIKAHLPSENRPRPHPGAIRLIDPVIQNILQQIKVLSHCFSPLPQ